MLAGPSHLLSTFIRNGWAVSIMGVREHFHENRALQALRANLKVAQAQREGNIHIAVAGGSLLTTHQRYGSYIWTQ